MKVYVVELVYRGDQRGLPEEVYMTLEAAMKAWPAVYESYNDGHNEWMWSKGMTHSIYEDVRIHELEVKS